MDVHKEAIVIAVRNTRAHLVMESIVETKESSILQFTHGLRANCTSPGKKALGPAGCADLLKPHVHQVLVCDPRHNALLKEGKDIFDKKLSCLKPGHKPTPA